MTETVESPAGFHFEWVEDREWRVADEIEVAERQCRWSAKRRCYQEVVAAMNRGGTMNGRRYDRWWFYCEDHLYGRRVEDGKVLVRILVPDST